MKTNFVLKSLFIFLFQVALLSNICAQTPYNPTPSPKPTPSPTPAPAPNPAPTTPAPAPSQYAPSLNPNEPPPLPIFHSFGYTSFLDIYHSPDINFKIGAGGLANGELHQISSANAISLFTILYRLRYNFYEPGNNLAFGVTATPSIGAGFCWGQNQSIGDIGLGIFNIPVLCEIDFGAGSTARSYQRIGGLIGLGLDYTYLPFFETNLLNNNQQINYSYLNLCANFGYRYWGRYENLREVNLKIDFINGFAARIAFIRNFGFY